jgi:hypothetical protein
MLALFRYEQLRIFTTPLINLNHLASYMRSEGASYMRSQGASYMRSQGASYMRSQGAQWFGISDEMCIFDEKEIFSLDIVLF